MNKKQSSPKLALGALSIYLSYYSELGICEHPPTYSAPGVVPSA